MRLGPPVWATPLTGSSVAESTDSSEPSAGSGITTSCALNESVTYTASCVIATSLRNRTPDRTKDLRRLDLPTLVIHGAEDPLIAVSGGQATAAAIPGAELIVIDGMGHDLPRPLWPTVAERIATLVARAQQRPRSTSTSVS
ncbi:MAG: alpha/beta hydrolase [Jiangellaceae bacterium]